MKGKRRNGQTGRSGKITPFPTLLETPEDLDETIKETLKREADEIEARLNADPNMIGVGASDDLFLKIKATLQEKGIWEEDPQEESGAENPNTAGVEEGTAGERSDASGGIKEMGQPGDAAESVAVGEEGTKGKAEPGKAGIGDREETEETGCTGDREETEETGCTEDREETEEIGCTGDREETEEIGCIGDRGKNRAAGDREKGKNTTAGDREKGKNITAEDREKGKNITAGDREKGKNIAAGDGEKEKNTTAGDREKGKSIAAGDREKGKNITTEDREKGKNIAAGDREKGKNIAIGDREKGKNIAAGNGEKGKNIAAGDREKGNNIAAGDREKGDTARDTEKSGSARAIEKTKAAGEAWEREAAGDRNGRKEAGVEKDLEEIYRMLPEEDLRALELGRRIEEENKKKQEKKKRHRRRAKYAGVAAAAVLVVFGVGMSTEASRSLILQKWSVVLESVGLRTRTNYADAANVVKIRDGEEYQAIQEICEELEITPVYLQYLPEGMRFSRYEIYKNNGEAMLFYDYEEKIVSVWLSNNCEEQINYIQIDEGGEDAEIIENYQNIQVKIKRINMTYGETYTAECRFEDCSYAVSGMISIEDMKEIVENMIILNN